MSSSVSKGKSTSSESNGAGTQKSSGGRSHSGEADSKPAQANSSTARSSDDMASSGAKGKRSSSQAAVQHERPNDFQAQADPDGDTNGGVDQPGGHGGVNTSDQDGNNGSGNDSDCEDDNRGKGVPGHCKDKPASKILAEEADVLGVEATADTVTAGVAGAQAVAPEGAQVLGVEQTAAPSAGILPQTGAAEYLTLLMLAGLGLVATGALTVLFRRRLQRGR